jgi:hypothetical protein
MPSSALLAWLPFPRSRSDRSRGFFRYGPSEDGGLDEVQGIPPCLPL